MVLLERLKKHCLVKIYYYENIHHEWLKIQHQICVSSVNNLQHKFVGFTFFVKRLLRNFMTGSVRFGLVYHKCWLTILKLTNFLWASDDFKQFWGKYFSRKKNLKLNRNNLSTSNSLVVASIESDVQKNVKCFGYPSVNLAVYNTGQQKKINTLSNF